MLNFSFTNWEKTGIIIIVLLIISFFLANYFIDKYQYKTENFDISSFQEQVNTFEKASYKSIEKDSIKRNRYKKKTYKKRIVRYYKFDPNTATKKDWINFGFSENQAKTIIKFIKNGKGINKAEDLKSIYVISESKYRELKPYINIKKTTKLTVKNKTGKKQKKAVKIELNTADAKTLVKVKGVGKKTASRIIKYRNLLGGFVSIVQLNEVYGITEENYNKMKNGFKINRLKIKKISLNFADKKELAHHPYISFEQARKIIDYRTNNGAYQSVNQVFELGFVSNEFLRYYLTLN